MTDSELRRLEREFRSSGTVQAEAEWLRARLQAGELSKEKLELAAYCGHEAAQEADPSWSPQREDDDEAWLLGLAAHGRESAVRALVAIARACLGRWTRAERQPAIAVIAAEDWLISRSSADLERAAQAHADCQDLYNDVEFFGASEVASAAALATFGKTPADCLKWGPWSATQKLCESFEDTFELGFLVGIVREDLIAFALGYRDPVRERVEARQETAGE